MAMFRRVLLLLAVGLARGSKTFDVTPFEITLLPLWIAQYRLPNTGNYSFYPHDAKGAHPYATSDVVHVQCFTNTLSLSEADKDAHARVINSWQRADGFFHNGFAPDDHGSGGSLWHAAGYVTAGLSILGRSPLWQNTLFEAIAQTPSLWEYTVDGLLNADTPGGHAPCAGEKHGPCTCGGGKKGVYCGCSSGYGCAQNIASLLSWQIQTNSSTVPGLGGGLLRNKPFVDWYVKHLNAKADAESGLWCTPDQRQRKGEINCIGGSFHIDFVYQHMYLYGGGAAAGGGADATWRFPAPLKQLNASLALQKRHGGWTPDGMAYLNVDGIYQATRPSLQAGKARWAEVEAACEGLMGLVVPALNNASKLLDPNGLSRNTHNLPALVGAVAECQKQFPTMITSKRQWRMCLDATPYI